MAAERPLAARRRLYWFGLGAVLLLCLAVYWPGLQGGFVFDDFVNILDNTAIRHASLQPASLWEAALSSPTGAGTRPLASLSFAIQMAHWGPDPAPFKAFNLILHVLNGVLFWAWLRLLMQSPRFTLCLDETARQWIPLLAAAAWLLAPINLTSVLYVVQRMEALAAFFTLLGLLMYTRIRLAMQEGRPGAWRAATALAVSTLLALGGKETGIMLPAYAFVVEWLGFGFRTGENRDRRIFALFALLLVLPGALGLAATFPAAWSGRSYAYRPFTMAERLLTEGRILLDYLRDIVLPDLRRLSIFHDDYPVSHGWLDPPGTLLAWFGLVALGFAAWKARHRHPLFSFGVLFFFVGHSLVSTYLPLELYHEHRNYLPSAGILAAVMGSLWSLEVLRKLPIARLALIAAVLGLNMLITALRTQEWSDPLRLAATAASRHPASVRAHYHYGLMLAAVAENPRDPLFTKAMREFEFASRLPEAGLLPWQALIILSAKYDLPLEAQWWDAIADYIKTRPLGAADLRALHALNECVIKNTCKMDPRPLGEALRLAHERDSRRTALTLLYAKYILNVEKDPLHAERLLQWCVARAPRDPRGWMNLAELQIVLGKPSEAQASLERLAELDRFDAYRRQRAALAASLAQQSPAHDEAS